MAKSKVEGFLNEAEECLQQSDMATNLLDKKAWLQLADEWMELAQRRFLTSHEGQTFVN
jgi:hypothetical protein